MKRSISCFVTVLLSICSFICSGQKMQYPPTKMVEQTDLYHGIQISDPYRWLEDVNTPDVQQWMKAQDETLQRYLSDVDELTSIEHTIRTMGKTGTNYRTPFQRDGYYYYALWRQDFDHAFLYRQGGLDGSPELLLDMNKELDEQHHYNHFSICPKGKYLAIHIRPEQHRYGKLRLFDVEQNEWLSDSIDGTTSAGVAWTDKGGFYYIDYGRSEHLNKQSEAPRSTIKFHSIGTATDKDPTLLSAPENGDGPLLLYSIGSSDDYRHLVVKTRQGRGDKNKLILFETHNSTRIDLAPTAEYMYNFVGSKGDRFYFYTNKGAPNGKLIAIDKSRPAPAQWKTIVTEQKESLAGGSTAGGNAMNLIGDRFVLVYREGTQTQIKVFGLDGSFLFSTPLETGWIGSGMVGNPDGDEAWFTLNGFLSPSSVYRLDLKTRDCRVFFDRGLPIDRADYAVSNTYYTSFDGTKVPIYICHKKGLKMDGSNPVYIYGYGFGGWVATPWYQPHLLTFLEMGGIYVLPGVRGGGEFGDQWRDAGIRLNRQNAIDDYIAAAKYLIEKQYTSAGKIVANGWSASGSLAAAVTIQRPDLFGAAMIGIPSLDLLRYEKFTPFKGWTRGYGSPDDPEEFLNLYRWSPYHNLRSNTCYPPMLVTVGEEDPTTPPQHGYKFVAALQAQQRFCESPALLKIVWGAGHRFGTSSEHTRQTQAQELAFLVKVLGLDTGRLGKGVGVDRVEK